MARKPQRLCCIFATMVDAPARVSCTAGKLPRTLRLTGAVLLAYPPKIGRVAQRESIRFTREGSQVQSLSRPPFGKVSRQGVWAIPDFGADTKGLEKLLVS
jgi:hypothetical protein